MVTMQHIKGELLEHYANKNPRSFVQFDVFVGMPPDGSGNPVGEPPDKDGDDMFWGLTTELMGGSDVRVLVPLDTSKDDVLRALRKIGDCVSNSPEVLGYPYYQEERKGAKKTYCVRVIKKTEPEDCRSPEGSPEHYYSDDPIFKEIDEAASLTGYRVKPTFDYLSAGLLELVCFYITDERTGFQDRYDDKPEGLLQFLRDEKTGRAGLLKLQTYKTPPKVLNEEDIPF
jgi:hypothetical protein